MMINPLRVFVVDCRGAGEAAGANYRLEGRPNRGARRQAPPSRALRGRRATDQGVSTA